MDINYILIAVLLFAAMLLYFRIADKYNIIDKPNQRSSHTQLTIRGGGVIFPMAMILYYAFFQFPALAPPYHLLVAGMVAISIVSFWDDINSLPNKLRIGIHLLSVTAMMMAVHAFTVLPLWAVLIGYIMIIGTINAYNFMDGINGITGVYSLVVMASCFYFNTKMVQVIDSAYILTGIIACLVFLFFNFRKKAKCFAGDVGSVSIGFWVISLLLMIILATGELKYIFFLAVYGADAVLTILHRLLLKQNIFEAHRFHFYQILANEQKVPHLIVAAGYGLLQLGINFLIMQSSFNFIVTGLMVCIPLALAYLFFKKQFLKEQAVKS